MTIDPYRSSVVSLLHFDDGFTDDVPSRAWVPNGSVSINESIKKIGPASLLVPAGSTHYLQDDDSSDWAFGLDDFTIECWVYRYAVSSNDHCIIGNINYSNNGWLFGINAGDAVVWRSNQPNGSNRASSSTLLSDNTWYHVAVTRKSGTVRIFVDGILEGTGSDTEDLTETTGAGIGKADYYVYQFGGYIDELRVTKGVARYTAGFDVQTEPFSLDDPTPIATETSGDIKLFTYPTPGTTLGPADIKVITGNTDVARDPGLETAVAIALFTDCRADDDDELPFDADGRGGWFGEAVLGQKFGSKLWLLRRSNLTQETLNRAKIYIEEALDRHIIAENVAGSYDVTVTKADNRMKISVTIRALDDASHLYEYHVNWQSQTGRS
jgi:phage gp46-like protein